MNQARTAELGVNIHPVSADADKEGAEIRQGLYRRIERDSNANQARLWALQRAVIAGRGVYRVNTKWDEDSDPQGPGAFDQEIVIELILHQESVYFDPASTKPDCSDGNWVIFAAWMDRDKFKREFPNAFKDGEEGNPDDDLTWDNLQMNSPGWVRADGDEKSFLVCEYWYREIEKETISFGGRERTRDIVSVKCAKMMASKVLSVEDWNGHFIPFIPVIGRQLIPFDGQRRYVGMVGPSRDGQRFYNYAASTFVERLALEPKAPYIMAEGQEEGHEAEWAQSNTRNLPYLRYKPVSLGDQQAPPPARSQIDQAGMSLAMQAMQEADRFIQATTSVYDPSLGRENPRDKSGKAILALQQQSDAGTSHFLASLGDVSMPYEALVVLDLMPAIYDRPGRITTIVQGDDDEAKHIMLNQPFVPGQNGGLPQEVMPQPGMPPPQEAKTYDLTKGKYGYAIDIGKSFQTRMQAGQEAYGQIISNAPEMLMVIGDLLFRNSDFPGATETADRMKKLIQQKNPSLLDQNDPGQQAQAELEAAKGQMQQMQQIMQQMDEALKTDKVKADADIEKTKITTAAQVELQRMKDATSIAVAEINARAKGAVSQMEAEHAELATGIEQSHEAEQADRDRAHEVAMAAMGHQNAQQAMAEGAAMEPAPGEAPEAPEPMEPSEPAE
jgi:hypothetical protein